jgi:hypothetical protein
MGGINECRFLAACHEPGSHMAKFAFVLSIMREWRLCQAHRGACPAIGAGRNRILFALSPSGQPVRGIPTLFLPRELEWAPADSEPRRRPTRHIRYVGWWGRGGPSRERAGPGRDEPGRDEPGTAKRRGGAEPGTRQRRAGVGVRARRGRLRGWRSRSGRFRGPAGRRLRRGS